MQNEKVIINNKSSEPLFYIYDDVFKLRDEYHDTGENDRFILHTMASDTDTFRMKELEVRFKQNKNSLTINITDYSR